MAERNFERYKGMYVPPPSDAPLEVSLCAVTTATNCIGVPDCGKCVYDTVDTTVDYFLYKGWVDKGKALEMTLSGNLGLAGSVIKDNCSL